MNENCISATRQLMDFIKSSPTAFQAVETISKTLDNEGYTRLFENQAWDLTAGGKYYVIRNQSSIISFRIPSDDPESFMIAASHTDSPTFKLKTEFEVNAFGKYIKLNTERYGGMIMSSWFDRPLSVAGRVIVNENGKFTSVPVVVDRDLVVIPNVAIHFNRSINDGYKYNAAVDTLPLLSMAGEKGALIKIVAEAAGADTEKITGADLYLYDRTPGAIWGAANEFFSSPRIDNLMCAYGTLQGYLNADSTNAVPVYAVFDNEETGSSTKQGAGSMFMRDLLARICEFLKKDVRRMLASSFMVSADNGHAKHPNHPELSDPQNSPDMNSGVVIKSCASQSYTTDGLAAAVFTEICRRANVPVQQFANRSDMRGGSTLGSILDTSIPLMTVDIGLAQLAMHSCYETAGCADTEYLINASKQFYSSVLCADDCGSYLLK